MSFDYSQEITIAVDTQSLARQTEKAILLEMPCHKCFNPMYCSHGAQKAWLPKSQITIEEKHNSLFITMPYWLMDKNGLDDYLVG